MNNLRLQQLFGFLELAPNDPETLYMIAYEYDKSGNIDEALTYYGKLKDAHPNYIGTYYHLGKLLERLDRATEAQSVYEAGIKVTQAQNKTHALGELKRALQQLEDDLWE